MDKQKQMQMINQIYEQSAKKEDDISKMTDEERKEYLRGRLRQKMFYSTAGRQSKQQKTALQERMQKQMEEKNKEEEEKKRKKAEKNRKKREKRKLKKKQNQDDFVKVEDESDYESDEN